MAAGKHVLTEKLMAHNITECKEMCRKAAASNLYLATGHQRHYSILYDNAVQLIRWGVLGQIHHIRAQWHRGNLPGKDSWHPPLPGGETAILNKKGESVSPQPYDPLADQLRKFRNDLADMEANAPKGKSDRCVMDELEKKIAQWIALNEDAGVVAKDFGYESMTLPNGTHRSALEELIRWRLWDRTGGGLMAELGSRGKVRKALFVTGAEIPDEIDPDAKADGLLRKPFQLEELFERVEEILSTGDSPPAAGSF